MIWHSAQCLHNELLNCEFHLLYRSEIIYLIVQILTTDSMLCYLILNYSAPLHLGHGYTALRSTETVIQVQVWDDVKYEHLSVFADTMQLSWCK